MCIPAKASLVLQLLVRAWHEGWQCPGKEDRAGKTASAQLCHLDCSPAAFGC